MKPRSNIERSYWYQLRINPHCDDGDRRDGLHIYTKDKKDRKRRFNKSRRRYDKRIIEMEKFNNE